MCGELTATMTLLLARHRAARELYFFGLLYWREVVLEELELIRVDRFTTSTEQTVAQNPEFREQIVDALGLLFDLLGLRIDNVLQDSHFIDNRTDFGSLRHDVELSVNVYIFKAACADRRV